MKEAALLLLPLLVTVIVLAAYKRSSVQSGANVRKEINLMEQQVSGSMGQPGMMEKGRPSHPSGSTGDDDADDDDTCSCPDDMAVCSVAGDAVLGGVDVVEYFTTFKLSDGSYNESNIGVKGSSTYSSTYDGFQYYFVSQENLDLFEASPTAYIPQWGGFCSWGIGYESCPPYPWAADCLGPSGNWGHWTIQNEKLYFFLFEAAKEKFMADPDTYIANGDSRWSSWFSDPYSHMSTHCYATNPNAVSLH